MGICPRCLKKSDVTIMSMFNTQNICLDCAEKEKDNPRYNQAKNAESKACRRGDFNFPGIGL